MASTQAFHSLYEEIFIGCSADKGPTPPCCSCGGGFCGRQIEEEAGAIGAICIYYFNWKREGDNSNDSAEIESLLNFEHYKS